MKWTTIFIILIGLAAWKNQATKNQPVSTEDDLIEIAQYSDNELISFLDSIGQLNSETWIEELSFMVDSVLNRQTSLNSELTEQNFKMLKMAIEVDEIDIDLAKQIFPKLKIDSTLTVVPIFLYSFDKNQDDFKKFAIMIGDSDRENDVYFFYGKKIIAKHSIFHRYGFEPKHFKNENNQTVVFYPVCYHSGLGVWWFQFNFYKYDNEQLVPILTEIQDINLQPPWNIRAYRIETEIINERPLRLKFVYYNQFYEMCEYDIHGLDYSTINFISDSTIVTYHIDKQSGKYIPNFYGTKQNRNKLTSYFFTAEEKFFINTHYDLFKNKLNENDSIMRKAILNYLNHIK